MSDNNNTTMGETFRQRRADRQQQQQQVSTENEMPNSAPGSNNKNEAGNNRKSLLDIQAEQENEQRLQKQQRRNRPHQSKGNSNSNNSTNNQSGQRGGMSNSQNFSTGSTGRLYDSSPNKIKNRDRDTNNQNNLSLTENDKLNGNPSDAEHFGNESQVRGNGRQQRGGRGSTRGGGGSRSSNSRDSGGGRYGHLPLEQGIICSLKDGFGFIHCADRPDQVFFHFSELRDGLRSSDLKLDTEVQFRIGEVPDGNRKGNNLVGDGVKKIAALNVTKLPTGTIVWEYPDETIKGPVLGLIERPARPLDNSRGGGGSFPTEGTIRILPDGVDVTNITHEDMESFVIVRYLSEEYSPNNTSTSKVYSSQNDSTNNNAATLSDSFKQYGHGGGNRPPMTLSRGDLVEVKEILVESRTKERLAKNIAIVLTERQRHFQAQEAKLLASATMEHGVVTAVKGEYGFLKSNLRHEEVYFHYSHIHPTDDDKITNGSVSTALQEGQELKFLVVTELGDGDDEGGRGRRRVSARQVQMQPAGSVQWHDLLAQGVTGEVVECPQPIDSGHPLETQGKVRLHTPIRMPKKHSFEEAMEREDRAKLGMQSEINSESDDDYIWCTEVFIWSKDSPGGNFPCRGGSSVGLYIQNGDILLFDVIRDYIGDGGTCRAAPTRYLTPREEEQEPSHLEVDDGCESTKAIRLIQLTLAGRAEGVVHALKDDTFGFLHFAERPVDVHFKMYQILPEALQSDLRRNMGLPEGILKLEVGAEVQFDLSVHGTIVHGARAGPGSNRKRQSQQNSHERENLKGQRILLLPPGTIQQTFLIAKDATGKICKQDAMQPYVGGIELDEAASAVPPEQRHPLVARMIQSFLSDKIADKIVYNALQSLKEDEVVMKMVEATKGKLRCSYLPVAGETRYPGLLTIEKVDDADIEISSECYTDGNECKSDSMNENIKHGITIKDELRNTDGYCEDGGISEDGDGGRKGNKTRKQKNTLVQKPKQIKSVRFDKNSISPELRNIYPLSIGDIVKCDVTYSRRTGQISVERMALVERHVPDISNTGEESFGVIKDVVPELDFGFITVLDKYGQVLEMLAFRLSEIVQQSTSTKANVGKVRKGDPVKFILGTDLTNGRHVAVNVMIHENKHKHQAANNTNNKLTDSNPCKGLVLLKLTRNAFLKANESAPGKKKDVILNDQPNVPEKKSRWDNVIKDEDNRKDATEVGCILLTEDDTGLFSNVVSLPFGESTSTNENQTVSTSTSNFSSKEAGERDANTGAVASSANVQHMYFKRANISIHSGNEESLFPHRGDLVSFNKTRNGHGIRDIRIIQRGAATFVRGMLESIDFEKGQAIFVVQGESDRKGTYEVNLKEIISCPVSSLKLNDQVEGILFNNKVYGVCRVQDLFIENKSPITKNNIAAPSSGKGAGGATERPKLNLTVKKDRGGTIMAQSRMAQGPDGKSKGFNPGWTTRLSAYATEFTLPGSND